MLSGYIRTNRSCLYSLCFVGATGRSPLRAEEEGRRVISLLGRSGFDTGKRDPSTTVGMTLNVEAALVAALVRAGKQGRTQIHFVL